jgi:hypothetical protein
VLHRGGALSLLGPPRHFVAAASQTRRRACWTDSFGARCYRSLVPICRQLCIGLLLCVQWRLRTGASNQESARDGTGENYAHNVTNVRCNGRKTLLLCMTGPPFIYVSYDILQ